jgi:hypothetical protein
MTSQEAAIWRQFFTSKNSNDRDNEKRCKAGCLPARAFFFIEYHKVEARWDRLDYSKRGQFIFQKIPSCKTFLAFLADLTIRLWGRRGRGSCNIFYSFIDFVSCVAACYGFNYHYWKHHRHYRNKPDFYYFFNGSK